MIADLAPDRMVSRRPSATIETLRQQTFRLFRLGFSSRAYKHGFPSRLIHRAGQRSAAQRLSNEPAGTTGCAPVSTPLLLAGGAG
jgi:hypothetical protein